VTTVPVKKCTSMQACYMYVDDSTLCCTLNAKYIKSMIVIINYNFIAFFDLHR